MSATSSDLYLSPKQQDLLMAALTSNQSPPSRQGTGNSVKDTHRGSIPFTPGGLSDPSAPGSGHLDFNDDSPYLDFAIDGEGDDAFEFDQEGKMFGDLPDDDDDDEEGVEPQSGLHEKRKSIDGSDEGGGKRREGEDKTAKKPGRKPLTVEPTSKRKAQNRAAQRAFRERKEKHLKDLETKVEDLEKASEAANHENGLLKAQVERLQVELKEYRKRLSWISSNGGGRQQALSSNQQRSSSFGNNNNNNNNSSSNNDFQFQFPKFGDLPATSIFGAQNDLQKPKQSQARNNQRTASVPVPNASASPVSVAGSRHSVSSAVPYNQTSKTNSMGNSPMNNNYSASPSSYAGTEQPTGFDTLSGLFSPSILEATRNSPQGYFPNNNTTQTNMQNRGSFDNGYSSVPGIYSNSSLSNTESPSSSSESHHQSSSIGTSPDPNFNSPNNKLQDFSLNTISEETNIPNGTTDILNGATNFSTDFDSNGFNWLAQQNGGNFDPVLFGDYRETQDNVLSQDFGSFFNDAYPLPELGSPSHNYNELNATTNHEAAPKHDLMSKVEAAKDSEGTKSDVPKMMTCNKIWDRLQSMEKFRNGEIDIDNLCSELRAKAKCSEGGAVVDEKHVNKILGL